MKYLLWTVGALAALVWGAWLIVIPADMIKSRAEAEMKNGQVTVELKGLRKGLFYSVRVEAVDIVMKDEVIASAYDVIVLPDWAGLFMLKPRAKVSGYLGGGEFHVLVTAGQRTFSLRADEVSLGELNLFALTGQRISGLVDLEADVLEGSGTARLTVKDIRAIGVEVQGFQVPEDIFHTARGTARIEGMEMEIESLELEGDDIFVRITGRVNAARATLMLDLMPESSDLDLLMGAGLSGKRVGPGHYRLNIDHTLKGS